jgi:hypothetical protein
VGWTVAAVAQLGGAVRAAAIACWRTAFAPRSARPSRIEPASRLRLTVVKMPPMSVSTPCASPGAHGWWL